MQFVMQPEFRLHFYIYKISAERDPLLSYSLFIYI